MDKRHGGLPINHMMVIRNTISKSRPDLVNEIYRMLRASRRMVPPPEGSLVDPWRFGVEANRGSLEIIIDYSFRQKLISQCFRSMSYLTTARARSVDITWSLRMPAFGGRADIAPASQNVRFDPKRIAAVAERHSVVCHLSLAARWQNARL
jgi:hypothetical protein